METEENEQKGMGETQRIIERNRDKAGSKERGK